MSKIQDLILSELRLQQCTGLRLVAQHAHFRFDVSIILETSGGRRCPNQPLP
jgi:hypothetical protein